MALVAKLYNDDRLAERYAVRLDGTLRNTNAVPQDVVIDDLSATGFRTTSATGLSINDVITLGIFGVGLRSAQVSRESDDSYGCQFLEPLTAQELSFALQGITPPDPIPIPGQPQTGAPVKAFALLDNEGRLSPRLRLLSITAVAVIPWIVIAVLWVSL